MTSDEVRQAIERALEDTLPRRSEHSDALVDALSWSVLGGGKRLRGILACATALAFGELNLNRVIDLAISIELMHAYSLVHDDLPAMDDADLRRGQSSTHRKFGEAMAILAGDALQAMAFDVIVNSGELSDGQQASAIRVLAEKAGWQGMVGGQAWDIDSKRLPKNEKELEILQGAKTGDMFQTAILFGLIAANDELNDALRQWGESLGAKLGCAFQMVDDLIDVMESSSTTGKPENQDQIAGKVTYPALLGLSTTRKRITTVQEEITQLLDEFQLDQTLLAETVDQCIERIA